MHVDILAICRPHITGIKSSNSDSIIHLCHTSQSAHAANPAAQISLITRSATAIPTAKPQTITGTVPTSEGMIKPGARFAA